MFHTRLVAKGYDQIAGVDFQENFAPVTSDVTFRMLLILWMSKRYYAETRMRSSVQLKKLRRALTLLTHLILKNLWDAPLRRMARNYCCLNQT